ncbi:MAG: hypothetical protein OXF76_10235 [Caldilineaceae bacterium]|nr:hypothetical protein [Caldilineaceae bacterium]
MSTDAKLDNIERVLKEFKTSVEKRFDESDKKLDEINNNVSLLKGATALLETVVEAPNIAKDMGIQYESTLTSNEAQRLANIIATQLGTSIKGELEAFKNTDLFIAGTSPKSGKRTIVPVAASWGLSGNDVKSVIKHAELVEQVFDEFLSMPAVSARNIKKGVRRFARTEKVHINQLRKVF